MKRYLGAFATAVPLLVAVAAEPAVAQKPGGILKMCIWDNPPSLSMLDGINLIAARTMMGVFNNLVMFDQHVSGSTSSSPGQRPSSVSWSALSRCVSLRALQLCRRAQ